MNVTLSLSNVTAQSKAARLACSQRATSVSLLAGRARSLFNTKPRNSS